jgi:hypothetical protein
MNNNSVSPDELLPRNVAKLPGAIHRADLATSDHLSRLALQNGWDVRRRSANYFVAVRPRTPERNRHEQISVWVRNENVIASRATIIEETDTADMVEQWLETAP